MADNIIQPGAGSPGLSHVVIRMPADLHARIKERAAKNGRSQNSEMVASLMAALDGAVDDGEVLWMVRQIHAVTVTPYVREAVTDDEVKLLREKHVAVKRISG